MLAYKQFAIQKQDGLLDNEVQLSFDLIGKHRKAIVAIMIQTSLTTNTSMIPSSIVSESVYNQRTIIVLKLS